MFKTVTNNLAIGSIAESEALEEIAQQGYKTIIDLCPAAEGNQLDASIVKELALEYVSVPVSPKNLTIETLEAFTALPAAMRYILKAESYVGEGQGEKLYCIIAGSAVNKR